MKISMYSIKNESTREFGVPFPAVSEYDAKMQVKNSLNNVVGIDYSSFSLIHSFVFDTEACKMFRVGHTLCTIEDLFNDESLKEKEYNFVEDLNQEVEIDVQEV